MHPQTTAVDSYIRTQGTICALMNALVNPLLAWLGYRGLDAVPLWGPKSVVVDTAITAIVLSLLVTLGMTFGLRRALRTESTLAARALPLPSRVLSHLPAGSWSLGLTIGIGAAVLLVATAVACFQALGLASIPLVPFMLLKAGYTAALGYLVSRAVIVRHLLAQTLFAANHR